MRKIHFIAMGGAAMHNLALAMNANPIYQVTGSDDEFFEPSRSRLAAKGLLPEKEGWNPEKITPDLHAVIVGMHATKDNPELIRAKELGLKIYSFPEYLYECTKSKTRVVIGGSHGKTTTTAMILFVLNQLGIETNYMVGAQIEGFENMVHLSPTARIAVFEGDEYLASPIDPRPKFHLYKPHIAVLTGIAWDHINVFPTFENYVSQFKQFTDLIEPQGRLIYFDGDENLKNIAETTRKDIITFPYNTPEYKVENGITYIKYKQEYIPLKIFGEHNLQNLNAARIVCHTLGVSDEKFFKAISQFTGATNRLEKVAETSTSVAYKDFAHSPSKLKATIHAVKEQYKEKEVIACMELHTFSSLRADFLPQYAHCMDEADVAYVYYNPKVIEHKRLQEIKPEDVKNAFASEKVKVFTDSELLQDELRNRSYNNSVLLMMSSGNFSGVNIKDFTNELLNK